MDADSVVGEPIILLAVGGDPDAPFAAPTWPLPIGSVVIAADSGLDRLAAAGIEADHVVGDLDSVRPGALDDARRAGATIHAFPADKDATDLELAVDLALELASHGGPTHLLVVGPGAGRLDLLLGDALLLCSSKLATLDVDIRFGDAHLTVVRPGRPRTVHRRGDGAGEQLSLLPIHGAARGVTTTGTRWPLLGADLAPGTSRALSNELVGAAAHVEVAEGVVLVVQPGTESGPIAPRATPYDPTPTFAPTTDPTPGGAP